MSECLGKVRGGMSAKEAEKVCFFSFRGGDVTNSWVSTLVEKCADFLCLEQWG